MKILVGLSGGVDSAVCALILKKQGYDVIGATMSIWGDKGIAHAHSTKKNACYGPDEAEDIESARKIAEQIGIPYYVFDCKNEYEKIVLENFKKEYKEGRTPNPCVWCNALVKFSVLPDIARLNGVEFDKFATGHYARVEENDGHFYLKKGIDPKKDQSYFLYRLTEDKLKNILLPLGELTKEETRQIAKENNLLVADKGDSQDFYSGDYNELLNLEEKEGNIVDTEGNILGKHKGIWNFTIGQRKGIKVSSSAPLYVIKLDKDKNEVVVGNVDKTFKKAAKIIDVNLINNNQTLLDNKVDVKIRSTGSFVPALVQKCDFGLKIIFDDFQKSVAPGQSIVIYKDDICLGGGVIDGVE